MQELYKYRHFENEKHLRLLTEREVYFASPSSFDDPNDLAIPIRFDLGNPEDIIKLYKKEILRRFPDFADSEAQQLAEESYQETDPTDPEEIERVAEITRDVNDESFGVLSLADTPYSTYMWEDYARQHTGFCVGLDADRLFAWASQLRDEGMSLLGRPVDYSEELPRIDIAEARPADVVETSIATKLAEYKRKKEYRLVGLGIPDRVLFLEKGIISSITLGANVSEDNRKLVLNIADEMYADVPVIQAVTRQMEV